MYTMYIAMYIDVYIDIDVYNVHGYVH